MIWWETLRKFHQDLCGEYDAEKNIGNSEIRYKDSGSRSLLHVHFVDEDDFNDVQNDHYTSIGWADDDERDVCANIHVVG
jgi:hypothetical protein